MRTLEPDVQNEIVKDSISPFTLIEVLLDSPDEVYLTTSHRDVTWNGNLYKATGGLIKISDTAESKDLKRPSMSFTLSGVDQTFLALVLTKKFTNRRVNTYQGLLSLDTDLIVGGSAGINQTYAGRLNSFNLAESPDSTSVLTWKSVSIWGDFERSSGRRTNSSDQMAYLEITKQLTAYPLDTGFDHSYRRFDAVKWGRE